MYLLKYLLKYLLMYLLKYFVIEQYQTVKIEILKAQLPK